LPDHRAKPSRFAFVGDIYLGPGEEPWRSARVPDLHEILGVDAVVGNFESTVDGASVGAPHPGKIHLSTTRSSVEKLRDMGVDVVSVANNHVADYGPEAAAHTIDVLEEVFGAANVFGWTGREIAEVVPGVRVAAACFPETNPVVIDGASRISTENELTARSSGAPGGGHGAAELIVYAHWGEEHLFLTAPELRARARRLHKAGVAHVVGTHSHVVGAAEEIDGFSVTYSLGNFLFHVVRKGNTRMLRRNRRGAVAVFSSDGGRVTLEEFWRSEFDTGLNLKLKKIERPYPGSALSQLHLLTPGALATWSYEAALRSRWFNLGLARLFEGVERPSLAKARTLFRQIGRRSG
jgi:poly-gamma-glutamate synthesis protein (capsule biosynthesis protein)